ncbi:MAG: bifunctional diaminohydroxyphosphoribosylaminopyrimidine deaminase/5-amino-6-(5-phosphoribosylamino)uracil reductase RibD [Gammaproteobacteria bacterium]
MTAADHEYMAHALRLAERGLYTAHPNPRVGCVLVKDDTIVGEGWHRRAGEPHAEIHALREAGEAARGTTAYVTLEPCCHKGRTPPCTEALIAAGVKRVVVAMLDPNPRVAGQGLKQLMQAGIEVSSGILQAQAETLNRGFSMRMLHQRPFVRCKLAMSLDGRTALANGKSQWITGPEARADVQRLRARSGAIMTGIGTVLSDDPSLTVRAEYLTPEGIGFDTDGLQAVEIRQPLRVVLDSKLCMPRQAHMLGLPGRTLIVTSAPGSADTTSQIYKEWAALEVAVVALPGTAAGVDLSAVLQHLATQYEINDVLLEAGSILSGAMLRAGLIDELVLYVAPLLLGDDARGLFHWLPGLEDMQDRIKLEIDELRAVGGDWRVTARMIVQK